MPPKTLSCCFAGGLYSINTFMLAAYFSHFIHHLGRFLVKPCRWALLSPEPHWRSSLRYCGVRLLWRHLCVCHILTLKCVMDRCLIASGLTEYLLATVSATQRLSDVQ